MFLFSISVSLLPSLSRQGSISYTVPDSVASVYKEQYGRPLYTDAISLSEKYVKTVTSVPRAQDFLAFWRSG